MIQQKRRVYNVKFITLCVFLLILSISTMLNAADKKQGYTAYTVKKAEATSTPLYFHGTIEPISQYPVVSPIAGLVSEPLGFNYGEVVNKGQTLFSLKPGSEEQDYRSALLAYLRAKSSYNSAKIKFVGQELLYKNQILSRNEFDEVKNSLVDQQLALREALYSLTAVIKKMNSDPKVIARIITSLQHLNIGDTKVYSELDKSFTEVKIISPKSGIALLPKSTKGSDSDSDTGPLEQNSSVKLQQNLVSIGDFTGLMIKLNISEISINDLKRGQVAEVTGPAFPNINLKGVVKTISYQAMNDDSGSGLPVFPITVVVSKLTAAQQKTLHPGMTAKVKIDLLKSDVITVPIKAVIVEKDKSFVNKIVDGKLVKTPITTGNTSLDNVEVVKGLSAGDNIAIAH